MSEVESSPENWRTYAKHFYETTPLTERQAEVYVLRELTTTDVIADELGIERKTVNRHLTEAHNRLEAAEQLTTLGTLHDATHRQISKPVTSQSYDWLTYTLYESLAVDGDQTYLLERVESKPDTGPLAETDNDVLATQQTRHVGEYADAAALARGFATATDADIADVALAHAVVAEVLSIPSLPELYPKTPDPESVTPLVEEGLISSDEARQLLDQPTDEYTHDQLIVGDGSIGPVRYPLTDGSFHTIVGKIGAGKSVTAKTLARRARLVDDEDAAVVFADPLGGAENFVTALDGTVYRSDERVTTLDDYTAVTPNPNHGADAYVETLQQAIDTVSAADRRVILVLDEAHYLLAAEETLLEDLLARLRENVYATFLVSQAADEIARLWDSAELELGGRDGVILHKHDRAADLQEEFDLTLDHIEYLRNAAVGTSDPPQGADALVLPPQNTQWQGVYVLPTPNELDLLDAD